MRKRRVRPGLFVPFVLAAYGQDHEMLLDHFRP